MRDFAGMSHEDRRKLFERGAFERFCDAREVKILDGSIEQPPAPAPDIRATIIGEGPCVYELVCLDDDASQERLNLMGDARALTRQFHQALNADRRVAFDAAFGHAYMMIAFVPTSGKRGVRKALPGLFEALMQLPLGTTGQVFNKFPNPPPGIERVHIVHDPSIREPEFTTSTGGFVGTLNLAKLEEKLGKTYVSDAPIELLAYAAEVSHQSDDDSIREIVDRMMPKSIYRRVWIFEQLLGRVMCHQRQDVGAEASRIGRHSTTGKPAPTGAINDGVKK
jgi:hypothetical protein